MDNGVLLSYRINDRSFVAFIKREIHNLVISSGFTPFRAGEVDIVVSELTSNLTKHVGEGELLYKTGSDEEGDYIEIYCIDNGMGIVNLSRMMQDGNSTTNTLGQGLGAINRLSNFFQIYSLKDWGTVQHVKMYKLAPKTSEININGDFSGLMVCCPGEVVSGDGYFIKYTLGGLQIFMGDGLGHGHKANEAVNEAIKAFKACRESSPAEILRYIHENVKKTRGLVATVASLDYNDQRWQVCGIGNITTRIYEGVECKNYAAYNGIIGHNVPRTLNNYSIPLEKYQTIIMHSDGLRTKWNLSETQSLLKYNPSVIAGAIYKDHARRNDDMSILVGKFNF